MSEQLKKYSLIALIALTSLPFVFAAKHPSAWTFTSENAASLARYASSVLGYAGIGCLLWMYILGTRSITGLYFKDLPWTLKIHRWLGTYGITFIFLHPFLAAYSYGESLVTYWLTPQLGTEFQQHVTFGRIAFLTLILIWVTSALLRGKIAYRPWKYIHYLTYIILPLSLLHVRDVGSSLGLPWIQFFYYSFVAVYLVVTALRARFLVGFGKRQYEIIEHKKLTPGVYLLRLAYTEKKLYIRPGQYVYLQRNLLSEEHPFTVLDYDNRTGEIDIAYKVYGSFTEKLAELTPGASVLIDGPYGVFTEEVEIDPNTPVVFIAAGIGVTPFVKHAMKRAPHKNTWLFYANRNYASATLRDHLKKLLGSKYVDVLSREDRPAGQNDERGHITSTILKKYLREPLSYRYFICGPVGMIESTKQAIAELGVNEVHVYAEEFGF